MSHMKKRKAAPEYPLQPPFVERIFNILEKIWVIFVRIFFQILLFF